MRCSQIVKCSVSWTIVSYILAEHNARSYVSLWSLTIYYLYLSAITVQIEHYMTV